MAILEVEHIRKAFGHTEVLKDIGFTLERGDVVSIIAAEGDAENIALNAGVVTSDVPDTDAIAEGYYAAPQEGGTYVIAAQTSIPFATVTLYPGSAIVGNALPTITATVVLGEGDDAVTLTEDTD